MNKPLVIGHRGAMGHETENTIASIQKALDLGVDMIEIDVFKIKSGEIVVFHDDTLERLTNGKGKIEEYTFEELSKFVVTGNHKIPLLTDILDAIDAQVPLNIELKGANTAKEVNTIVLEYVKDKDWELNNFIISSFNWEELRIMRDTNTNIRIAVLTEENPVDAIPMAKKLHAEAINPNFKMLSLEIANTIRDAGFKIYTWTVNEPNEINGAKRWAVDGIITNFPERVN
ncbi:glycerophosphodiester phosphodiesterase family protein [uncultured Maribacter sp.]|uniref:glycerophosphodiester phosphodiesterase n=1 Tax=uncultured Maribacter sp. TaxID=431308 RepID=UPI002609B84D|nr:glycerophosphodiester phosphodiesterase family protein [uncultured Maribacter sp.]